MTPSESSSRDDRVDAAIAAYMEAIERGEKPDRLAFLAEHSDIAAELNSFLDNAARFLKMTGDVASDKIIAPDGPVNRIEQPVSDPDEPTMMLRQPGAASSPGSLRYFGDYELLEEIARGGMGVVYKARQVTLNRIVAVKMILGGQLAGPEDVQRFHIEAEAAAQLDHPGIVPIYEVGSCNGQHYFSMGYIEGESLARRVARGPLEPRAAAEIVKAVAVAVQYAHDKRVIHRDLKPGNILLDEHDRPRVTDFGLAKLAESGSDLTRTGQILGTPSYMPPEQAASQVSAVGQLSDVYSLGAILYCLLAGRPPFQAANPLETLLQVQRQDPVSPRQLNQNIPQDLDTIVLKCLDKSPLRRYASAQALADELDRYLTGQPILARRISRTERFWRWCKRNPVVAVLCAAVLITLLTSTIVSGYFAYRERLQAIAESTARGEEKKQRLEATKQTEIAQQETRRAAKALIAEKAAKDDAIRKEEIAIQQTALAQGALLAENAAKLKAQQQTELAETRRRELQAAVYLTDMNRIEEFARVPNLERIRSLLERHLPKAGEPDLRGWEWYYWWRWVHREESVLQHELPVRVLAASPDGKTLAVGLEQGWIQLWNMADHSCRPEPFRLGSSHVAAIAFLDRGTRLGAVDSKGQSKIWQLKTGQLDRQVILHESHPGMTNQSRWPAAISRDGRYVLNGDSAMKESFQLQQWLTRRPVDRVVLLAEGVHLLSHVMNVPSAPNSAAILTATDYRHVPGINNVPGIGDQLIPSMVTTPAKVAPDEMGAPVFGLTFSPDGRMYASGDRSGRVRIWDRATHRIQRELTIGSGIVWSVAYRDDGRALAAASHDGSVKVWSLPDCNELATLNGHVGDVRAVAFLPDGQTLVTAGRDSTVRLWDVSDQREILKLTGHIGPVLALATADDGKKLMSAGADGTVRVWQTGGPTTELRPQKRMSYERLMLSGNGQVLAGVGNLLDRRVALFDAHRGTFLKSFSFEQSMAIAIDHDGKRLAVLTGLMQLDVIDIESGRRIASKSLLVQGANSAAFAALAFSPDGKRLASLNRIDHSVSIFDAQTLEMQQSILASEKLKPGSGFEGTLFFTPDSGQLIGQAGRSSPIVSYDPAKGTMTGVFAKGLPSSPGLVDAGKGIAVSVYESVAGRNSYVLKVLDPVGLKVMRDETVPEPVGMGQMATSPDSALVAVAAQNKISVWDRSQQRELSSFPNTTLLKSMELSGDGRRLYVCSMLGGIRRFDLTSGTELPSLGAAAGPIHSVAISPNEDRIATWVFSGPTGGGISEISIQPEEDVGLSSQSHSASGAAPESGRINYVAGSHSTISPLGLVPGHVARNVQAPSPDYPQFADTERVLTVFGHTRLNTLQYTTYRLSASAVSLDGKTIAVADDKGQVTAWHRGRPEAFELTHRWQTPGKVVTHLTISAGGTHVAVVADREVHLWDLATDQKTSLGTRPGKVTDIDFSASGRWLGICSEDGSIGILEQPDFVERRVLKGHTGAVLAAGFPDDDRTVLSAGEDGTFRAWDLDSGELKLTLSAHRGPVTGLDIGRKSGLVATGGKDGVVRLWPIASRGEVVAGSASFTAGKLPEKANDEMPIPVATNTSDRKAVAWLERMNASFTLLDATSNYPVPYQAGRPLSESDFTVATIEFPADSTVDDDSLANLQGLEGLTGLRLAGTRVQGRGLKHVAGLVSLRHLDLTGLPVSDQDLFHLRSLAEMESLLLAGTKIGDESLKSTIVQMPRLRRLFLDGTSITDDGLAALVRAHSLRELGVRKTQIRGSGLAGLPKGTPLAVLLLDDSSFDDEGSRLLPQFEDLAILSLAGTRITDATADRLIECKRLQSLDLGRTRVTQQGYRRLLGDQRPWGFRLQSSPPLAADQIELQAAFLGWKSGQYVEIDGRSYPLSEAAWNAIDGGGHVTGLTTLLGQLTDDERKLLQSLPRLNHLTLAHSTLAIHLISSDGTIRVPGSSSFGLRHLAEMPHLKRLSLSGQSITNAELAHVEGLVQLESLELNRTAVDKSGLARLVALQNLTAFKASFKTTSFRISDLSQLPWFSSLQRLEIEDGELTAEDLVPLGKLSQVTSLSLEDCKGVAAVIESLKQLKTLKRLNVSGARLSRSALDALRRALPNCQVDEK